MPGAACPSFVLCALDRWHRQSLKSRRCQPAQVPQSANALDVDQRGVDCPHIHVIHLFQFCF